MPETSRIDFIVTSSSLSVLNIHVPRERKRIHLVARAIRNVIRTNRLARIIRN